MSGNTPGSRNGGLSAGRRAVFTAIAVLLPFLLLAGAELVLRATWKGGAIPLFVHATSESGQPQLVANPSVAQRWFLSSRAGSAPPGSIPDPFPVAKPAHTLRIFAMGESTTAGFPYPHNGTFARMLRDALQDVLPGDSVEVVNLGIPATSSYAMVDEAGEVIAQHPDAIVIYAGHNEFYGALAVGSTQSLLAGAPWLVRVYLRLQRLRTVMALRDGIHWMRARLASGREAHAVTLMETLVADQQITLDGPVYKRGEHQFESNLSVLLDRFRAAHVPVFIASQASNLRDQHPFAVAGNAGAGGADSVYAEAQAAWARGDSASARTLFTRARDLDVVRFRASSDFNSIIKREAAEHGATYVPVAERIAAAASGGVPGHDLFLEHLHPNEHGVTVMAHAFFDAIQGAAFMGRTADTTRLRQWSAYERGMDLTPLDERIADLSARAVSSRWPFVPVSQQVDVRRDFRPANLLDSLALEVSAGAPWPTAKLRLARDYEQRGFADSAVSELRGVVRDSRSFAEPWELLAAAFVRARQPDSAYGAYRQAIAIRPSVASANAAAAIALELHDYPAAISMLQVSLSGAPQDPRTLYQLSLAYALSRDLEHARAAAARLAQVAPDYPGLSDWLRTLGARPPA